MVFSSVPVYLDPPNWQQQANHQPGGSNDNPHLPPQQAPPPLPPVGGGGSGGTGTIRPGSMADRARLAKLPQPETALKCPRCESTNTKFCYFNNYSLSQPRHFCKACRRYWTRGGALRNVPVGGGCRRNKRSKGNRSKSPVTGERQGGSSSASAVPSNSCTSDMIGHLPPPPPPPQLSFLPPLHHLADYGAGDIGLNFGGIQPPVAVSGGGNSGTDIEFPIGSCSGGGGPILSGGLAEHWRLQQVQQFPFLAGLEPPSGLYSFEGEGTEPPSYLGGSGHLRAKALDSGVTQMTAVKIEENQGLNLSRNFLGLPGNDQYWSGNTWNDLSGFNSSTTSHLL
ncbi:hypothetical protein VitviT2T_019247 [Vitis vinifera]|uniref:Dof zinc finger protein n=1 Tax=Vitis vinifera TaxID=29760 RepID=A0ABY9D222_VITVI|nr:dof zinc finger protein DOF3.6 isoform X1 [Vitis vinifera]WKA00931.1 hypothetical protein VitviT2T_019247 [Vitis vinifera]|eukprot:XP_002278642.1 PREDICTED: dof zinc finger protein DOF3.6 isoform X1 [Vitis vinifera]